MKIKDRPEFASKAPVLSFAPNTSVADAVKVMSEKNYGSCMVVDGGDKPIGIVTERDLMRRVLAKDLDQETTKLSDIMTSDLRVARADDNLLDWLRQMSNDRFRHLPIVDESGKLVNMMSQGDFVSYTWPELLDRVKENVKASIGANKPVAIAIAGVMVYSLFMVFIMASFIGGGN